MLSIWVLRLKVKVEPTADPCLLPTSTRMASAGLRNRLVNSTFRWRVDLGGMVTWSPLGTQKSLASWPATRTWYCKGLPLGLLSLTWSERRNEQWDLAQKRTEVVYFLWPSQPDLWTKLTTCGKNCTCLQTVVWRRPENSTVAFGRNCGIFW